MNRQTAGVIASVTGFSIAIMAASPSRDNSMDQPILSVEQSSHLIHTDRLNVFRERREAKEQVYKKLLRSEISLVEAVRENIRINESYPIDLADENPILLGTGSYGEQLAQSLVNVIRHETSDETYWVESDYQDIDRCELIHRVCTEYDEIIQSGKLADVHAPTINW